VAGGEWRGGKGRTRGREGRGEKRGRGNGEGMEKEGSWGNSALVVGGIDAPGVHRYNSKLQLL